MHKIGLNLESSWIRPRRTPKIFIFYVIYTLIISAGRSSPAKAHIWAYIQMLR